MSNHSGNLYIVATPIGNLDDISVRAKQVLARVDLILAEDTRHSRKLLNALGLNTPMRSCHDFNEREVASDMVRLLQEGKELALISDAGTPLISDPGYHLVNMAHEKGITVVPVPGPSALICALSAAGLPTDRFTFEGFAPERPVARLNCFRELETECRTIVFYESPHRIMDFLRDAVTVFGASRPATLARELTKKFESLRQGTLEQLLALLQEDEQQRKGEFVVVIRGNTEDTGVNDVEVRRVLKLLLTTLPVKKAAALAAEITGKRKNELYQLALQLKPED